mmetsp:Transcript_4010/g.7790  ORF Transcript_4010/g.7790 Transcript_4010/m.7790 type:complete len:612 (-) Transcript_4010:110-1945(-)
MSLATIADVVRHAALTNGDGLATRCEGRSHTWRELALLVARLAGGLASAGVEAGVRVGLLGQNTDHYLHLIFAVTVAGGILVPLNVRSSATEINFVLEDSGAAVLCAESALVQAALPLSSCVHTLVMLPAEATFSVLDHGTIDVMTYCDLAASPPLAEHAWCGGGEAAGEAFGIFFTSGTTGGPKGVVLSHANQLAQARSKLAVIPLHRGSRYLCTLPLFHIGGMNIGLAATVAAAATLLPRPRTAWAHVWRLMREEGATVLALVPAMLQLLLDAAEGGEETRAAAAAAAAAVEHVLVGGQSMEAAQRDRALRLFSRSQFVQTYACTEACSSISFLSIRPAAAAAGMAAAAGTAAVGPAAAAGTTAAVGAARCAEHGAATDAAADAATDAAMDAALRGTQLVGWPVAGTLVAILDAELRELPPGRTGQIATAGPHVMHGYWRQPTLTREVLVRGWLLTGDLGILGPDGALYFAGRIKDLIKSGGENVPAALVERALLASPLVAQAAVFGLPDAALGERVVAAVVAYEPSAELKRRLWSELPQLMRQAGLAQYMRPRQLVLRRALPLGPSGKVLKREIRRSLLEGDTPACPARPSTDQAQPQTRGTHERTEM